MNTADRIRDMLIRDYKLDASALTLDARLDDLGVDSLGMTELLFNIEDEFAIAVPDEPVELSTFGAVVNYIDQLVATRNLAQLPSEPVVASVQPAP